MLMWAYLEARVLDEAIREAQSTPQAEGPEAIFPMSVLGCAYADAGQPERGVAEGGVADGRKTAGADRSILSRNRLAGTLFTIPMENDKFARRNRASAAD